MTEPKLIASIESLNNQEIAEFGRYIKTKVFKVSKVVIDYYDILRPTLVTYQKNKNANFTTQQKNETYNRLNAKALKKLGLNKKQLKTIQTKLSLALQKYFVLKELELEEVDREQLLIKAYKRRGLNDLLLKEIRATQTKIEKATERDMYYHYHLLRLNHDIYYHSNADKSVNDSKITFQAFNDLREHLDKFYFLLKHHLHVDGLLWEIGKNKKIIDPFFDSVQHFSTVLYKSVDPNTDAEKYQIIIKIYQIIIQLFEERDLSQKKKEYGELRILLTKNRTLFSEKEQLKIFQFLLNLAILGINQGHKEYYSRQLALTYKFGLRSKILLVDNRLALEHFNNIVNHLVLFNQMEWLVNDFIPNYQQYLPKEEQENALNFAYATIAFKKGDFKKSSSFLIKVDLTSNAYKVRVRSSEIQLAYEEKNWLEVIRLMMNFNKTLKDNDNLGWETKKGNQNFTKTVKRLLKIVENNPRKLIPLEEKTKLKEELLSLTPITNQNWLIAKIDELVVRGGVSRTT